MRLWLDLDAVIVNFRKQYKELTGECIRCRYTRGMPEEEIWDQVDMAGGHWWATLPWMDDGKELWDRLKEYDVHILSAGVNTTGCREGKIAWVINNLGIDKDKIRIVERDQKSVYSGPNELLIDDYDKNCISWTAKGGIAIQHTDTKSTIKLLDDLLEKYDIV